jgi:hypothetical protein
MFASVNLSRRPVTDFKLGSIPQTAARTSFVNGANKRQAANDAPTKKERYFLRRNPLKDFTQKTPKINNIASLYNTLNGGTQ